MDAYAVNLAEAVLKEWVLSEDAMSGETWDFWCEIAGVEPRMMARAAMVARERNPRLGCGHFAAADNLYYRYGRAYCRACQRNRRLSYFARLKGETDDVGNDEPADAYAPAE